MKSCLDHKPVSQSTKRASVTGGWAVEITRPPVSLRRAITPGDSEGETTMVKNARRLRPTTVVPRTTVVPKITAQEAAKEFSAVVLDFSAGELATATGSTKEAAKHWKAGNRFPDGPNLKALEAAFPRIRAWANGRWGIHDSSQRLTNGFAILEQMMASNTAEGRAMRARFQQIIAERNDG